MTTSTSSHVSFWRRGSLAIPALERRRRKRHSNALALNLELVGIDSGGVGDRNGDAVHVHAGAASMSYDP